MEDSILISTKKMLGISPTDDAFDLDVISHINSVFYILSQLGVGPDEGFAIEDDTALWSEFVGPPTNLNALRSYVFLRVRKLFDPPGTSFLIEAMDKQIAEYEWRLNVSREIELYPYVEEGIT